jgi:hypothetical protein
MDGRVAIAVEFHKLSQRWGIDAGRAKGSRVDLKRDRSTDSCMSLAAQRGWPFMRGRLARAPYLRLIAPDRQGPSAGNDPDRPLGKGFFNGRQRLSYAILVLRLRSPQPEVRYPRQQTPPGQAPVVCHEHETSAAA